MNQLRSFLKMRLSPRLIRWVHLYWKYIYTLLIRQNGSSFLFYLGVRFIHSLQLPNDQTDHYDDTQASNTTCCDAPIFVICASRNEKLFKKIGLKSFSLRRQDITLVGLKIYPFNSEDKEVCFVPLPDLVLGSLGVIKNVYISTQC